MKAEHLVTLILLIAIALPIIGVASALTQQDMAPVVAFTPKIAAILDTDPRLQNWLKSSYSLTHVSVRLYEKMSKVLVAYADCAPPESLDGVMNAYLASISDERRDALLRPFGYQKVEVAKSTVASASFEELSEAKLALKGAEEVLLEVDRVVKEVELALDVDRLTDAAIEEERKGEEE